MPQYNQNNCIQSFNTIDIINQEYLISIISLIFIY